MQVERIRFEEVFDAPSRRGSFSFRTGARKHYGVQLPDQSVPRAGAVFAVAFGKAGDWSTVLGWRDLTTGRVKLAMPALDIACYPVHVASILLIPLLAAALICGGATGAVAALLATLACTCLFVVNAVRRNRRIRQALMTAPA